MQIVDNEIVRMAAVVALVFAQMGMVAGQVIMLVRDLLRVTRWPDRQRCQ